MLALLAKSKAIKPVLYTVGGLLAAGILWRLIKGSGSEKQISVFVDIPPDAPRSIGEGQAQMIATSLYDLLSGYTTDEEEDKIIRLLSDLEAGDLLMVYNAFGQRSYYSADQDLFTYLQNENSDRLNGNEMRMIWQKTGLRLPF